MTPARTLLPAALALAASLSGCEPYATVEGRLLSAPDPSAAPIPGAVVALYDVEGGRLGHDDTDEDGFFRVADLPPDIPVATVCEATPDFVPTVFVGNIGRGLMTVADGDLHALSVADAGDFIDSYGDLAVGQSIDLDEDGDGGSVRGQVWADLGGGALAPLSGVSVEVYTTSETVRAVYLDDGGDPDPMLEQTSASGAFAVFGLPPGTWAAAVGMFLSDGSVGYVEVPVMVVEDGVTLLDNLVFQVY